jgi:TolB-like protein/DNA-binding winged helix-turn-helix (wHTH) protein
MSESQYKFAEFQLDCARFELRRQGRAQKSERISLERIPMELLILLLERQGSVVSRQEIIDRLWGKDVFVDTEHGINTAIRKVRHALKDDPDNPRFILTVSGKGYRFVAEENGNQRSTAPSETPTAIPEREPRPSGSDVPDRGPDAAVIPATQNNRAKLAIVIAICVVVAAILISFLRHRIVRANQASRIRSIAVIPLANLSGDRDQEYFADDMTDELITMLAKNTTLRVVSRTSVMQYKSAQRPVREIASELGVDGILEGSINRSENHVHMTVQLIYAPTDSHVWAESYDRDLNHAYSLPEELSQTIAKEVQVKTAATPVSARYINPEAHDAYLHGRYFWLTHSIPQTLPYFQKAIELQPDYAAAWSGLSDTYALAGMTGDLQPREAMAKSEAAARKALELGDSLAEAHHSMCAWYLFYGWDLTRADAECHRSLELDPNSSMVHYLHGNLLLIMNRPAEGLAEVKRSVELDPFARSWGLGEFYLDSRQYDAAITELTMQSKSHRYEDEVAFFLSEAYWLKGMYKESEQAWEESLQVAHDNAGVDGARKAWQQGGAKAFAQWDAHNIKAQARQHYVPNWSIAWSLARTGDKDETLKHLEAAYRDHAPNMTGLQNEPIFDFLHGDPRYQSLVKKIGLQFVP